MPARLGAMLLLLLLLLMMMMMSWEMPRPCD
jgi:hypothetical protein